MQQYKRIYSVMALLFLFTVSVSSFVSCNSKNSSTQKQGLTSSVDSDSINKQELFSKNTDRLSLKEQRPYFNHVKGHDERDTIVGKFNGRTMDTLFVGYEFIGKNKDDIFNGKDRFFIYSSNKHIPEIELYGIASDPPKIVNEGDLDGNGTCEVGYLHTWDMSQWRQYRIFTLVKDHWRYLVDDIPIKGDESEDCLSTPEWFRASGVDIADPGPKKGWVKIHYATRTVNPEIKDTLVRATFSKIRD